MEHADDGSTWAAAQGERDAKPFVVRVRQFPAGTEPAAAFPTLFVIEVAYQCFDETRLPFREQYEQMDRFEQAIFDVLEQRGQLKFVFAETGDGKVRYFTYVRDPDAIIGHLNQQVNRALPVEVFSGADPQWNEYRRRLAATLPPAANA